MVFPFHLFPARRVCFSIMTGLQPAKKTTLNFADNKEVFQLEYSQRAILRYALFQRVVNTYIHAYVHAHMRQPIGV